MHETGNVALKFLQTENRGLGVGNRKTGIFWKLVNIGKICKSGLGVPTIDETGIGGTKNRRNRKKKNANSCIWEKTNKSVGEWQQTLFYIKRW